MKYTESVLDSTILTAKHSRSVVPIRWQSAQNILCRVYVKATTIIYGLVPRSDIEASDEDIHELIGAPPTKGDYLSDMDIIDL